MNNATRTTPAAIPPEVLALTDRVDHASQQLFAGTELQRRLGSLTRQLTADCQRLSERGMATTASIVVLGSLGEGKSWLARCFLTEDADNRTVAAELRSGQDHDDRTNRLTWFGPARPPALEEPGERFFLVPDSRLIDLGRPYVVGDTPGFSDVDQFRRLLAGVAGTSATVKILVCSFSQIRDGSLATFVRQLDGSVILPVIRFRPSDPTQSLPPEPLRQEVQRELEQWQRAAPAAQLLVPCYVPDKDLYGEAAARSLIQQRLQLALAPRLAQIEQLRTAVDRQIQQRLVQTRRELAEALGPFRDRVGGPVEVLDRLTNHLPDRLVTELVGEDLNVRAVLRPRFRADWLERTPAVFFPYRTLLGLLALTAGAWDRLVFSLVGSAPSLVLTFLQATKNVRDLAKSSRQLLDGLNQRVGRLLQDEFRPAIRNFRAAVASSLPAADAAVMAADRNAGDEIRVVGLDAVEAESRRIFLEAIQRHRASWFSVWASGLGATTLFVYLIAGPLVALYRSYLEAHANSLGPKGSPWTAFPTPSAAMLLSSLLLSVVPVFVCALLAMTWSCRAARINAARDQVQQQHREAIQQRFAEGSLRIELTDPQLDAARSLLLLATEELPRDSAR